jgi:uncharacterized protein YndB with AHSA1/START domain
MKPTTKRSIAHATFAVERVYDAPPERVFKAWSEKEAKMRWFGGPPGGRYELDFREGGSEHSSGRAPNGKHYTFDARYEDIVPDERIVYTYWMSIDGVRISVSLSTMELRPEDGKTRLVYTEHGAFLDGLDTVEQREHGTRELLDKLGTTLG